MHDDIRSAQKGDVSPVFSVHWLLHFSLRTYFNKNFFFNSRVLFENVSHALQLCSNDRAEMLQTDQTLMTASVGSIFADYTFLYYS